MKKAVSVILALVLIMLPVFSAVPAASENVHIMIDKTWKILLPENPTDAEQFTAGKLKECLSEVFGAEIEAVSSADEKFIAVGSVFLKNSAAVRFTLQKSPPCRRANRFSFRLIRILSTSRILRAPTRTGEARSIPNTPWQTASPTARAGHFLPKWAAASIISAASAIL